MDKGDVGLSELQHSLLIMNGIRGEVSIVIKNFPNSPVGQDEELKFILANYLELKICNFLEEFAFLQRELRKVKKEQILRVLAPLYAPIKENSRIEELRNKNIAHGHRDKKGRPAYGFQVLVEKNLPQYYESILFLGRCVVLFVQRLRRYLKDEVTVAESKFLSYSQQFDEEARRQAQKEIKSVSEIEERLKALLNEVDIREIKMRT